MGSSEPLGTPVVDNPQTQDSDTIVLDDDDQPASPGVRVSVAPRLGTATYVDAARKRKMYVFVEEDVGHMTFIIEVVKAVAVAINNAAPPDVHPAMYSAIMDVGCLTYLQRRGEDGGSKTPLLQQGSGKQVCPDGRGPHEDVVQDHPGQALLCLVIPCAGVVVIHA
jgi:hypothetical protein